jgi:superfamily I DNA and/or RNA helicase
VATYVRSLVSTGVNAAAIGVITPYRAQVTLLRALLCADFPKLEVGTVDGFQVGSVMIARKHSFSYLFLPFYFRNWR